jgi:uncharacterized membrane protein YhaH (DUF805 family)
MKKLTAWIIIVFCSAVLLIFAMSFFIILPAILEKNSEVEMPLPVMLSTLSGAVIIIALLVFGLRNGIRRLKSEKSIEIIPYTGRLGIQLQGKISYRDYRNLILAMTYKKPVYLVFICIFILLLLSFLSNSQNWKDQNEMLLPVFIFICMFMLSPFIALMQVRKIYLTSKMFHEQLQYDLKNESIHIKGETFDSTLSWDHFYRIRETDQFFLLFHGKAVAMLLDKKMFKREELDEFRKFTLSLKLIRG